MSFSASVFNIMIASPSDVLQERNIAREVIYYWNALHAQKTGKVLLPIGWESHSYPFFGDRAQAQINRQVLDKADLLVAIFWTRLGTPTGVSMSGPTEEIERHLEASKPIMVYFSERPVIPDNLDQEQYSALKEFKEWCKRKGLIETYEDPQAFQDKFTRQLTSLIAEEEKFGGSKTDSDDLIPESGSKTEINLSDLAARMLKVAATSAQGEIVHLRVIGGAHIRAGKETFCDPSSTARERAQAEGALQELEDIGLIESLDYQRNVFHVTAVGYSAADQISIS